MKTKRRRPLWQRIMSHWVWTPIFTVYVIVMAYVNHSVTMGIAAGLYVALVFYNFIMNRHERRSS